eukprot:GHVU01219208.1.p1 GENE.GHVU01219208.1~~GHVU01219208.1.p1  ORF type:complete len:269 (+),score=26.80 GHVU01219208.1:96-809(+)
MSVEQKRGAQTMIVDCCLCVEGGEATKGRRLCWKRRNGTGSLNTHMKASHPQRLKEKADEMEKEQLDRDRNRDSEWQSRQTTTSSARNAVRGALAKTPYPADHPKQLRLVRSLLLHVCKDLLPLSFVSSPWLTRTLLELDPHATVPSREAITRTLLPALAAEVAAKYATPALKGSLTVAITFDLWMSCVTKDVFSIIAHTLDDNFNARRLSLCVYACVCACVFPYVRASGCLYVVGY